MEQQIVTMPASSGIMKFDYFNAEQFQTMQRLCNMFAASPLVPEQYRIKPDSTPEQKNGAIASCMIATELAMRIGASPLMVMQNLNIIQGRPAWSSKFLIASVNSNGRFKPLRYKFESKGMLGKVYYTEYVWEGGKKKAANREFDASNIENIVCIAYTEERDNDIVLESSPVSVEMAIKEGWWQKAGSKWPIMTKKMMMYRAASFWTNEYAPEISLGMDIAEEEGYIPFEEIKDPVPNNSQAASFDTAKHAEPAHKETAGKSAPEPQAEKPTEQNPI